MKTGYRIKAAVDCNLVVWDENGDKKGQSLDMIPMGMGNEYMRLDRHFFQ